MTSDLLRPALGLLLACTVFGADPASDDGRIRVKFRALALDEAILGAGYQVGRDFRPLDISSNCFTAEQSYVGLNPLQLLQKTEGLPEQAPETIAARTELTQAEQRIQALAKEIQSVEERLNPLTSEIRERGAKARSSLPAQIRQLETERDELSQRMNALSKAANAAREKIYNAPARPGKPETKQPKKPDDKPKPVVAKENDLPPHRPLADVKFPGDGRYLVLIQRTPTGNKASTIDDKEGAFPYGSMQFMNLAGVEVEVRFGNETLSLKPNAKGVLRPSAANNTYAEGEIFTKVDDQFLLGYSMRIFKEDNVRTLYFLMPGEPGSHGVRLKGIEERRQPEAAPTGPIGGGKTGQASPGL